MADIINLRVSLFFILSEYIYKMINFKIYFNTPDAQLIGLWNYFRLCGHQENILWNVKKFNCKYNKTYGLHGFSTQ